MFPAFCRQCLGLLYSNIHPKNGNHISPGFTPLFVPIVLLLSFLSHINNDDIAIPAHIIPVIKGTIAFSPFVLLPSRLLVVCGSQLSVAQTMAKPVPQPTTVVPINVITSAVNPNISLLLSWFCFVGGFLCI